MLDKKPTAGESFRSSLEDLQVIIAGLAPHFDKASDLLEAVQLAMTNDGQLQMLMTLVKTR